MLLSSFPVQLFHPLHDFLHQIYISSTEIRSGVFEKTYKQMQDSSHSRPSVLSSGHCVILLESHQSLVPKVLFRTIAPRNSGHSHQGGYSIDQSGNSYTDPPPTFQDRLCTPLSCMLFTNYHETSYIDGTSQELKTWRLCFLHSVVNIHRSGSRGQRDIRCSV